MPRKQFLPTNGREIKALLAGYFALNGTIIAFAAGAALVGVVRAEAPELEKLLLVVLAYSASMVYWLEFTWKPSGLSMLKWLIACAAVGGAFANAVFGPDAATGARSPLVLLALAAVAGLLGYLVSFLAHADELSERWAMTMSPEGLAKVIEEEEAAEEPVEVLPAEPAKSRTTIVGQRAFGLGVLLLLFVWTRAKAR